MRILVTGGAGFIGSHVVDLLVKKKHKVIVIDNLKTGSIKHVNPQSLFFRYDINSTHLDRLFAEHKFDAVIHLAAHVDVRQSMKKPLIDTKTNVLGSLNIIDLCRKHKVKKIIYASSAAAYGAPQYLPLDEKHPLRPISNYGISKQVVEHYLDVAKAHYGIDYNALRFANVYGPRQGVKGEAGVIGLFIKHILEGKDITVFGDGRQTRDYIYVSDVAKAVVKCLTKNTKRRIMNISTGKETPLNHVITIIKREIKQGFSVKHTKPVSGDVLRSRLDNGVACHQLSWHPEVDVEQGIKQTIFAMKKAKRRSK